METNQSSLIVKPGLQHTAANSIPLRPSNMRYTPGAKRRIYTKRAARRKEALWPVPRRLHQSVIVAKDSGIIRYDNVGDECELPHVIGVSALQGKGNQVGINFMDLETIYSAKVPPPSERQRKSLPPIKQHDEVNCTRALTTEVDNGKNSLPKLPIIEPKFLPGETMQRLHSVEGLRTYSSQRLRKKTGIYKACTGHSVPTPFCDVVGQKYCARCFEHRKRLEIEKNLIPIDMWTEVVFNNNNFPQFLNSTRKKQTLPNALGTFTI